MTMRNAMNERTQNGPVGHTRKSAASAKPKNKAASSVYVVDPSAKPKKGMFGGKSKQEQTSKSKKKAQQNMTPQERAAQKKKTRAERDAEKNAEFELRDAIRAFRADTPAYHKWRRVWAACMIIGLILAAVMLIFNFAIPDSNPSIALVCGFAAWAFFMLGIFVDMKRVKPAKERAYFQSNRKKKKKQ